MTFLTPACFILYFLLGSEFTLAYAARYKDCNSCKTRNVPIDTSVCGQTIDKTSGVIQFQANATNLAVTCNVILNIAPYTSLNISLKRNPCASPNQTVSVFGIDPNDDNTPMKQLRILENRDGESYIFNGTVFIISYFNSQEGGVTLEQSFFLEFEGLSQNTENSPSSSTMSYQNFIISNPTMSLTSPDFQFTPNQLTTWFIHGPIYQNYMISYMYSGVLHFLQLNECSDCVLTVSTFYQDNDKFNRRSRDWVRSFYTSSQYPIRVFEHIFTCFVVTLRTGNNSISNPEFLMRWNYLR